MKKRASYIATILIAVALPVALAVSCRNTSHLTEKDHTVARTMKASDIISKTDNNKADFQYFTANITANVTRKSSIPIRLTGQLRMRRDSVVWLNLTGPLGIGTLRVLVTNDSVWMTNSLDKTCSCGKFSKVMSHFGVNADFAAVENALLGSGTILSTDHIAVSQNKIEPQNNTYIVPTQPKHNDMLSVSEIQITPSFKTSKINATYGKNDEVEISYSNFTDTEAGTIPQHLNMHLYTDDEINISIDYSKITINEKKDFPFKINSNYKIKRIK